MGAGISALVLSLAGVAWGGPPVAQEIESSALSEEYNRRQSALSALQQPPKGPPEKDGENAAGGDTREAENLTDQRAEEALQQSAAMFFLSRLAGKSGKIEREVFANTGRELYRLRGQVEGLERAIEIAQGEIEAWAAAQGARPSLQEAAGLLRRELLILPRVFVPRDTKPAEDPKECPISAPPEVVSPPLNPCLVPSGPEPPGEAEPETMAPGDRSEVDDPQPQPLEAPGWGALALEVGLVIGSSSHRPRHSAFDHTTGGVQLGLGGWSRRRTLGYGMLVVYRFRVHNYSTPLAGYAIDSVDATDHGPLVMYEHTLALAPRLRVSLGRSKRVGLIIGASLGISSFRHLIRSEAMDSPLEQSYGGAKFHGGGSLGVLLAREIVSLTLNFDGVHFSEGDRQRLGIERSAYGLSIGGGVGIDVIGLVAAMHQMNSGKWREQ